MTLILLLYTYMIIVHHTLRKTTRVLTLTATAIQILKKHYGINIICYLGENECDNHISIMLRRRIRLHNNQIINRTLVLILTAFTSSCHPWLGVSVDGIKLTQAKVSPLGRQDRVPNSSATNDGLSGGISNVGSSSSDGVPGSGKMSVNRNTGAGGGEILAAKSYPVSAQEPTCEELRAMWIFSKRQSRAAEITNEIPTYRDPFAYNVWDPFYSTTRSLVGLRMLPRYLERSRLPVFGRIISREPTLHLENPRLPMRPRYLSELTSLTSTSGTSSQIFGSEEKLLHSATSPRRQMQYRFSGVTAMGMGRSGTPVVGETSNSVDVQGSFQKLKELIWTERAKELTKQRRTEELAARAAVLKEIAKGQNFQPIRKHLQKSDALLMDKNRNPEEGVYKTADPGLIISEEHSSAIQNLPHGIGFGYNFQLKGSKFRNPTFSADSPSTKSTLQRKTGDRNMFPLRPSHFRERNRSLFKEQPRQRDFFSRYQRFPNVMDTIRQTNKIRLLEVVDIINPEHLKIFFEQSKKEETKRNDSLFELEEQSRPKRLREPVFNLLFGNTNTKDADEKHRRLGYDNAY